jgi:hypothetical protein
MINGSVGRDVVGRFGHGERLGARRQLNCWFGGDVIGGVEASRR